MKETIDLDLESEVVDLKISQDGERRRLRESLSQVPKSMVWSEFTRNGLQAGGDVAWYHESTGGWAIADTGHGMSYRDIKLHLAHTRNSGGISVEGKHGIGARILALCVSPSGVTWTSLRDGLVSRAMLYLPKAKGIKIRFYEEFTLEEFLGAGGILRPELIQAGHGTQVSFSNLARGKSESIAVMLGQRWFRGTGSSVGVARPWDARNRESRARDIVPEHFLRVLPIGDALNACAVPVGSVSVEGATVHAWILPETNAELDDKMFGSGLFKRGGGKAYGNAKAGIGVMLENEVYSFVQGGGAHSRLKRFGVTHGMDRVVVIVEAFPEFYGANDYRTGVVKLNVETSEESGAPWEQWASDYRENMPDKLRDYVHECMFGTAEEAYDRLRGWYLDPENQAFPTGGRRRRPRKPKVAEPEPELFPDPEDPEPEDPEDPGPKPNARRGRSPGGFWPRRIEWTEFAQGSPGYGEPCEWTPGEGGLLQMNCKWSFYRKLVTREQEMFGLPEQDAEEVVKQALVTLCVDVIARTVTHDDPEPGSDKFCDMIYTPFNTGNRISQVKSLIRYATAPGGSA